MQVKLTVTAGPHQGAEFLFTRHDTFLVGRSRHAHFQLPVKDKYFSRVHFMMEVNPPYCRLVDMGSHNGTYVNGQKVTSADLQDGDQIRAGHTMLQLKLLGKPAEEGSQLPGESPSLEAAIDLAGYRLERELGRGGMGVVYLVRKARDGSQSAMKMVRPTGAVSSLHIKKFLDEVRKLSDLDYPGLVRLREAGQAGSLLYFLSDYVPGVDAGSLVKTTGPLAIARAIKFACQILKALEQTHARGGVHRDIKPANLLIEEQNGIDKIQVADFGLARVYSSSQLSGLTITANLAQSAAFMPPELLTNYQDAQPAMDQYAVAATLYYLLTAQYIFNFPQENYRQFSILLRQQPIPILERRPDLPAAIASAIHKALARNPSQRFDSVGQFRQALVQGISLAIPES